MSAEPDFNEYPDGQITKQLFKQFVEPFNKQFAQIQSLFEEESYHEAETAIEEFFESLPEKVASSIDYTSLKGAFSQDIEKDDISSNYINNIIDQRIEIFYSVMDIKLLIQIEQLEFDKAFKTGILLLGLLPPTGQDERRLCTCIHLGIVFVKPFNEQFAQIQSLFEKKSYHEAETVIEKFFESLPEKVASSTDYTSLKGGFRPALETFFQDIEKDDVSSNCINNIVEQIIEIFYCVMGIKLLTQIEQLEFENESDNAIKTGIELLGLLPPLGEKQDERRLGTCINLGLAYSKWGKFDEALSWFEKASVIDPSSEYIWLNKGIVTSKKALRDDSPELFEQALNYFKDTLTFTPQSIGAQVGLAFTKELIIKPREFRNKLISHEEEILDGGKNVIMTSNMYLKTILNDMRIGLNIAMIMFIIQFIIGLFLIFLSVHLLIEGYDAKFNALIGSSGALISVIALYLSAPLKIQQNRVNLAQWNIIFSNWANAIYITNTLIAQKMRRGENTKEFTMEMNGYLQNVTNDTVGLISTHLEK